MSVVPFQDFAAADEGMAWDKGAQHKAALAWIGGDPADWSSGNWKKFRSLHLWYDSANAENVTSYKFQIAGIVDGSPKYVYRAASASLAILRGGRGAGPSADWWNDRSAMEGVLKKVYAKFDKDFPEKSAVEVGPEHKDLWLEIKSQSLSETGEFEGLASTYGNVDLGNDVIEHGAFTKSIQERGNEVVLLWSHRADEPVGLGQLFDSPEGLVIKGRLELALEEGRKTYTRIKKNLAHGLSIGFQTVKADVKDGIRYLKEVKLYEVSLCVFPMNPKAQVLAVKMAHKDFNSELYILQLQQARYLMVQALYNALDEALYEADPADHGAAVTAAEETLAQFHDEYLAWLPQMLAVMSAQANGSMASEPPEVKIGRRVSAATRKQIEDAIQALQALLEEEAGDATSSTGAAEQKAAGDEPDDFHSLVTSLKSLAAPLPKKKKEGE